MLHKVLDNIENIIGIEKIDDIKISTRHKKNIFVLQEILRKSRNVRISISFHMDTFHGNPIFF